MNGTKAQRKRVPANQQQLAVIASMSQDEYISSGPVSSSSRDIKREKLEKPVVGGIKPGYDSPSDDSDDTGDIAALKDEIWHLKNRLGFMQAKIDSMSQTFSRVTIVEAKLLLMQRKLDDYMSKRWVLTQEAEPKRKGRKRDEEKDEEF